jgi:hypothetical protein
MDIKIEQSSNDSKKCSRYKEVKNLPQFYKNKSEKYGFSTANHVKLNVYFQHSIFCLV